MNRGGEPGGGGNQGGVPRSACSIRQQEGVLQADPHVIATEQGIVEDRPSSRIVTVLETWKSDATALEHTADDRGGSNRIVGPRLDLDQDPQATLDEVAVDEGSGVCNRAEPCLDGDALVEK